MDRAKLIELVQSELENFERKHSYELDYTLVNFWNDEVFWDRIASIAVDVILKEGDGP